MLRNVFLKTIRDQRRGFFFWSAGLAGLVALILSVYPTVRDNPSLNRLVESYPEALKGFIGFGGELDYVSAAGYLGAELFSFVVPLLLLIAAISAGSAALAGEEERGTLELLLALPLSRRRVVAHKLGALVAEVVGLGLVLWLSLWAGARILGMGIGVDRLGAATASAVLLAVVFGAIALAVGAGSGRRAWASSATAAVAVAAYIVNSLAPLVPAFGDVQKASPFYHYAVSDPLRGGLEPAHVLVLAGVAAAAGLAALIAVERRDLAV